MDNKTNLELLLVFMLTCMLLYSLLAKHFDILAPFHLTSILYMVVYVFGPMYYVNRGINTVEGVEVMSNLPLSTLYFVFGYFMYFIGSILGANSKIHNLNKNELFHNENIDIGQKKKILQIAWIIYLVGIALSMVYYVTTGRNLLMMISFGRYGAENVTLHSTPFAFFVYFLDLPIVALMLLFLYQDKGFKKWVALVLYLIITISAGFRYLPLCFLLSLLTAIYLKRGKRPSLLLVGFAIFAVFIFVGVVGLLRGNFKDGSSFDLSKINMESISAAFRYNSDIFFPFYCMVGKVRDGLMSLHYGRGVLYVFIYVIPRFLWPGKPTSLGMTAFEAMWGDSLGGAAYPANAEFYYEFGFGGMLLCMFLVGFFLERKFKRTLRLTNNYIEIIEYAVLYGYLIQFVNRGYFAGWVFDILFFMMPLWITKYVYRNYGDRQLVRK